ncbi:hypothetical protein FHX80_112168 [Streptomyces brevispora]|uniref:Uncharacterized protein n=1 Tax=Streptomyces brevispora TaxID=887462 RepID=A0A561UWI4_9ACTN|nr:hypothetical protein [Streptomyces brevispora]TWG03733.1 hypothetical protein FHX80_112168 [Streptomyces brevispora]
MGMEVVVGMLIAWAAGKARRAGTELNGITDRALELTAQRLWDLVEAKLGTDPAIQRLVSESQQNGDATPSARTRAETALQDAADHDPRFAAALEAIVSSQASGGDTTAATGVPSSSVQAGGAAITGTVFGNIKANNKVVNRAARNPLLTVLAVALVLAALVFGIRALTASSGGDEGKAGSAAMVGNWKTSDSSSPKVFGEDGRCSGFYYNNGAPLDIGGPMTCTISSTPDADDRYTLVVTQSPNQATYKVAFDTADHAQVYSSSGQKIYEINRF